VIRTRGICGIIESNSNGFIFNFTRNDNLKINDFFSLIEDLKCQFLLSKKYRGCIKKTTIQHHGCDRNYITKVRNAYYGSLGVFPHKKLGNVFIFSSKEISKNRFLYLSGILVQKVKPQRKILYLSKQYKEINVKIWIPI
jgi:hypothetical protein